MHASTRAPVLLLYLPIDDDCAPQNTRPAWAGKFFHDIWMRREHSIYYCLAGGNLDEERKIVKSMVLGSQQISLVWYGRHRLPRPAARICVTGTCARPFIPRICICRASSKLFCPDSVAGCEIGWGDRAYAVSPGCTTACVYFSFCGT